jgi:PAS domain S-box-containing protein
MHTIIPLIFRHGPVVIFQWANAPHWPVEYVTPNVESVLGYSAEEFRDNIVHYDALIHPDDKIRVTEELALHAHAGTRHFQQKHYRTIGKNGHVIWLESHVHIVRDAVGKVAYYLGYVIDITSQKSVELERVAILNAVPDLMFTVNSDGEFLDYHVRDFSELAMQPAAFLGKKIQDVFPDQLGHEGAKQLHLALTTGQVCTHEYSLTTLSGDTRDYEARYIAKGNGEALVIIRDINQINQAKSNLRDREAQLNLIANQVQAVFWSLDTDLRFSMIQGAGLNRLGMAADQLVGRLLNDYLGTDDPDFLPIQHIRNALSGNSVSFDFYWMGINFQSFVEPLYDEKGNIIGVAGISLDITERKQAELRLSASEARFKDIAESMSDWIWETDANGIYTYCSERVEDILGYRPEEIIGRTPFDFMAPDEAQKIAAELANIAAEKSPVKNLENWNLTKVGRSICLLTSAIPLLDDAGNLCGYRGVNSDITERKLTEQALIQAKEEAEIASKAKSQFMSRMSHELRTPLNAILGYTELLMDPDAEDTLSDNQHVSLNTVHQAGRHLLYLINEVLDLAKIEAGAMTIAQSHVNWYSEISQCIELTSPLAEQHGVHFHMESENNTPELLHADAMRLKQVLLNLLSNAVKYNRRDGDVTIKIKARDKFTVRIEVHDTGAGLSEQQIANLFQPFNRLSAEDSETEGVGIGLVISKHLIELMGGSIGVRSELGHGTVFWVDLAAVTG